MLTILGVSFGRELFFGGGLKSRKNKAEKFAEKFFHQNLLRNLLAIFLKFSGPK